MEGVPLRPALCKFSLFRKIWKFFFWIFSFQKNSKNFQKFSRKSQEVVNTDGRARPNKRIWGTVNCVLGERQTICFRGTKAVYGCAVHGCGLTIKTLGLTIAAAHCNSGGGGPFEPLSQPPSPPLMRPQGPGPPQAPQDV